MLLRFVTVHATFGSYPVTVLPAATMSGERVKIKGSQMRSEDRFQWLTLGMLVVLLGMTLRVTLMLLFEMDFVRTPITTAWQVLGGSYTVGAHVARSVAFTLPTVLFCLYVLGYAVDRDPKEGGESYCRRCGHILRSLSKPRCPECGEAI